MLVHCEMCGGSVAAEEAVEQVYGEDEGVLAGGSWWACRGCLAAPPEKWVRDTWDDSGLVLAVQDPEPT